MKNIKKSSDNEKSLLTMCWFGFYQPYATSIVHVPTQEISPNEIKEDNLIFIWDKYMKSDLLTELLKTPVPWSPAYLNRYERKWIKKEDNTFHLELIKSESGGCLGAVILITRLSKEQLKPLIYDYEKRGYYLKETNVLVGDLNLKVNTFLR
ncbi:MAG: hypothetical protein KGD63_15635 [Candidatus Lokiarchaeota archaeon]|nr:hypothetical protein [Candidatus Lokiarchaeota archaeon]